MCGLQYGVVNCKELCAVQVLDSLATGVVSDVIDGINFIVSNCPIGTKCIANMSLGTGVSSDISSAMNTAVNNAVLAGATIVVVAGNNFNDACTYSPASADKAITIGAADRNNVPPFLTNWGPFVDIYGQGDGILAAWTGSATNTQILTNLQGGTSTAAPHVAALAAAAIHAEPTLDSLKRNLDYRSPGKALAVGIDCSPCVAW